MHWALACPPRTQIIWGKDRQRSTGQMGLNLQLMWNLVWNNVTKVWSAHKQLRSQTSKNNSPADVLFPSSPCACRFLFEGHEDFSCLPTFGVIPSQAIMLEHGLSSIPGLDIDYSQVRGMCEYKWSEAIKNKKNTAVQWRIHSWFAGQAVHNLCVIYWQGARQPLNHLHVWFGYSYFI